MDELIILEEINDFEQYNPVLTLNEDIDFDNCFYVFKTEVGNVAFSYYSTGVCPNFFRKDEVLFLSFGYSYYVINLREEAILHQSKDMSSVIFEILISESKSRVVFIGELILKCFSLDGELLWNNIYRNVILDWTIEDDKVCLLFENGEKWEVSLNTGNGTIIV